MMVFGLLAQVLRVWQQAQARVTHEKVLWEGQLFFLQEPHWRKQQAFVEAQEGELAQEVRQMPCAHRGEPVFSVVLPLPALG